MRGAIALRIAGAFQLIIWLWTLAPGQLAFKISVGLVLGLGIFGLRTIIQGLFNTLPGVRNQQPVETRIQSM